MYEVDDYTTSNVVRLVDDNLFRPNGVAISPNGSMLYVSESCMGDFEPTCSQGMVKFHQYQINMDNRTLSPKKIGSIKIQVDGIGASDGLKIHPRTGFQKKSKL